MYARLRRIVAINWAYAKQYRASSNRLLASKPPGKVQYSPPGELSINHSSRESLPWKHLESSSVSHLLLVDMQFPRSGLFRFLEPPNQESGPGPVHLLPLGRLWLSGAVLPSGGLRVCDGDWTWISWAKSGPDELPRRRHILRRKRLRLWGLFNPDPRRFRRQDQFPCPRYPLFRLRTGCSQGRGRGARC